MAPTDSQFVTILQQTCNNAVSTTFHQKVFPFLPPLRLFDSSSDLLQVLLTIGDHGVFTWIIPSLHQGVPN